MTDAQPFTHQNDLDIRLFPVTAQELLADASLVDDGSVDLLLTDPPYIISRDSGFRRENKDGTFGGNPQYAISTDFGDWDRGSFTMADLEVTIDGAWRVLRDGGTAIIFFDLWKASDLAEMMTKVGFVDVTMIEWEKTNAVPINSRKNYLSNAREIAIVGRKPVQQRSGKGFVYKLGETDGRFHYPIYSGKDRFHSTQKSLGLFEELVRAHTNEGDLVLDCFSGSATTGVAAIRTGRNFIGCEPDIGGDPNDAKETRYFQKSSARLLAALEARVEKAQVSFDI